MRIAHEWAPTSKPNPSPEAAPTTLTRPAPFTGCPMITEPQPGSPASSLAGVEQARLSWGYSLPALLSIAIANRLRRPAARAEGPFHTSMGRSPMKSLCRRPS